MSMFTNISRAGVGSLVTVTVTILKLCGIQLPDEAGGQLTEAIVTLVGLGLLVWGQVGRPDLVGGLFRR